MLEAAVQGANPICCISFAIEVIAYLLDRGYIFLPPQGWLELMGIDSLCSNFFAIDCKQVIMDCANLTSMDYSAAEAFYHGAEALKNANIMLKFAGLRVSEKKQ